MSPEQAKGQVVDKRTDVWAFGCCRFESLTGKPDFQGETVSETLAKILEREPRWEAPPERTPAGLLSLLKRCLRKDPRRRIHDIADVRIALEETLEEPSSNVPTTPHREPVVPVLVGMIMIVTALIVWSPTGSQAPVSQQVTRTTIPLLAGDGLALNDNVPSIAISRDGQHVAYIVRVLVNA